MKVTAEATRSGAWWAVTVPKIPGLHTQAKRLDQIPEQVIDAALLLGVEVTDVETTFTLPADTHTLIRHTTHARNEARAAEVKASALSRSTITVLREQGFTVRDVAHMLNLSPQRVSALTKTG